MKEIARVVPVGDKVGISAFHGGAESGVLDEPVVDKEVLFATGLTGEFGFCDISVDFDDVALFIHGVEPFSVVGPEELDDTLGEVARMEVVQ